MKVYDTETHTFVRDTQICSPNLEENPSKEDENQPNKEKNQPNEEKNQPNEDDYVYQESSNCSTVPEEVVQRLDNLRVNSYSYRTVS